jgi:cytochrome c oxidase subunit 2
VPRRRRYRFIGSLGLLTLVATGCAQAGVTEQGQKVHSLFVSITWIAAPVFVIVEFLLVFFVFRYRKRDDEAAPQRFGSNRWLVIFFLIPTIIVGVVYGLGEATLASVQKEDPNPQITIRVEGAQWAWTFYYLNEGFYSTGKTLGPPAVMEVPVDVPVRIELVSKDVIHSFFVPAFLYKRDVIPGRTNAFTFTATDLGTYNGQCAEFCGLYHSRMRFTLNIVTQQDYLAWVHDERTAAQHVTCPVTGNDITVTALNTSWDTACIAVNANVPISLTVTNNDLGIDHNFAVYDSPKLKQEFFQTGRFPGVATNSYQLQSLRPGTYYFQCDVHGPSMSGTFIAAKT